MNNKTTKIEKLKDIIIVVLVLNSILLLYFFWGEKDLSEINLKDLYFDNVVGERFFTPEDVALPSRFVVGLGNEEYMVMDDSKDVFLGTAAEESFLESVKSFMGAGNLFAETITKEQYDEVFAAASMRAEFDYYMPFSEFCSYYGIQNTTVNEIKTLSAIGYSTVAPNNIFIYDKENQKYCRIVSENNAAYLENILEGIYAKEFYYYYPMKTYLGAEITNNLLMPLHLESDMALMDYTPEINTENDEDISEEATEFFGNSADFIRKIEEAGGRTIFMYGYADIMLIVNSDGSVEYKDETAEGQPLGYFESLDTALAFIESKINFGEEDVENINLYLVSAKALSGSVTNYRFEFGMEYKDNEIFADKELLVVEVNEGAVSYFYKDIPVIEETSEENSLELTETIAPINVLALNNEYICEKIKNENQNISFEEMAELIISIKYGYFKGKDQLIPVWEVKINGFAEKLYFDLYTAEPVE